MNIEENVKTIYTRISTAALVCGRDPCSITLMAATKQNNADRVAASIRAGIRVCGENRVQELLEKNTQGAYEGSSLHFIGHLQSNKVNKIVGVCDLIQSVHSLKLLSIISSTATAMGIVQDVLLEVNIAVEESKSGFLPKELPQALEAASRLPGIRVRGLMAIPPISTLEGSNRCYFKAMHQLYIDISTKKYDNVSMDFLSMGMSGDFEDAIAEGSNMIRVGSAIFGARLYPPADH